MISCLTLEMSRTISLGAALEDVVLEPLELVAHLAQHREATRRRSRRRSCRAGSRRPSRTAARAPRRGAAALEQVLDRRERLVRQRDEEVGADEDVELGGVEPPDRLVEAREVQDDEQVVVVLVDLRALVARGDVLVVERVEVEVLLEPGAVDRARALDVDPAQAVRPRRPRLRRPQARRPCDDLDREHAADATEAGLGQVRHGGLRGSSCHRMAIFGLEDCLAAMQSMPPARVAIRRTRWLYCPTDIAVHIQRGGGTGPMKPRQPSARKRERCQFHQVQRRAWEMWTEVPSRPPPQQPGGGFSMMPPESLKCKECGTTYPLDARYVCERCFGPLEVAYARARRRRRRRAPAPDPGRPAEHLALRRLPAASRRRRATALPAGCTPLVRADRLAERLGLRRGLGQERRRQPDALVQGPRRHRRAGRARRSSASRSSPAPRPATSPTPSPPTPPPPGLESYVFIPADLEEQKILATGVYGTNLVAVSGNYDDVNRLCTELSGEHDVGVRQRQHAARTTPRARRRSPTRSPSSSAGSCPTGSSRRSPPARCSPRSPAASRSGSSSACVEGELPTMNGAQAERLLAGRAGVRGRPRRLPPGQAGHDRQVAGDRQPGRRPLRARSRAPHRRRRSTRSPTTRSATASGCSPRRPASSPRPPAA